MSDTSFGSSYQPAAGPGASGADVPPTPSAAPAVPGPNPGVAPLPQSAPPPQPSTPSIFGTPDPSANPVSQFGSGLNKTFGGTSYQPAPAGADATDQSINLLQQRIQRASGIATGSGGPMAFMNTIFDPEGVQKARDAVPKMTQELQALQQQKAKDVEVKQLARNYGINNIPAGADRETATNMMADQLQARYLKGDPVAATALTQLGRTDLVQAGGEQALSAAAANNERYRAAIGKLNNVQNAGQYAAAYRELQQQTKDGKHQDWELASVPKTFDEYQDKKQMINNSLSTQQLQLNALKAKMQQLGGVTPIQKAVDKDGNAIGLHAAVSSQLRDNNGNPMGGVEPVTVGGIYNGNRLPSGSGVIGDAGTKWGLMTKDEVKDVNERIKPQEQTVTRAAGINKLNDISSQKDFGSNAWLLGHGVDQFVEISRNGVGGRGAATPGTIQIMENLRGHLQTMSDKAQKEWRQVEDWVDGGKKGPQPYMSAETIGGLKDAISTLKQGSDKEISGVAGGIANYVGRHGGKLDDIGLEPGVADVLRPMWQQGNQDFKQDIASRPAVVMGGQRIVFDRDGVKPPNALTPGGFDQPTAAAPNGARGNPPGPGGTTTAPGGGGPQQPAAPPTGGPTPGRYGVPPGMQLNTPQGLDAAANRTIQIESGFKPGQQTGSYKGYGQWSNDEMKRHGITDPNDLGQTQAALKADIQTRAAKLQKDGLPVTPSNVYLMHQQGEAGLEAHLRNPQGAAWQNIAQYYKSPAIAKQAVWGNMTPEMKRQFPGGVDSVTSGDFTRLWEARYAGTDNAGGPGGEGMRSGSANIAQAAGRRSGLASQGRTAPKADGAAPGLSSWLQGGDPSATNPESTFSDAGKKQMTSNAADVAPAAASTIGQVFGGPVGGGIGGGAGSAAQDLLRGQPIDKTKMAEQAALGTVLGVGGLPRGLNMVARAVGAGGVEAGAEAARGGENHDVLNKGLEGAGEAFGGEAFGRALGMAGHKVWSMFSSGAKEALQSAAKAYHEATGTLATENPKLPGVGGAAGGANPKYEAAEAAQAKAETTLKDAGLKPEEAAYAHKVSSEGVPKREAQAARPGATEEADVGRGYQQLEGEVGANGVGAPKASPKLPDGPRAAVESGNVPKAFGELAERVEAKITAPAANWQDKWNDLKDARSDLLGKERDAYASTGARKGETAEAYRALADTVRVQQAKVAKVVFGEKEGEAFMGRLKVLDTRYRNLMEATNGGDLAGAAQLKGEAGREADKKFRAFAQNDKVALAAWGAMRKKGGNVEQDVLDQIRIEKVPYVGTLVGAGRYMLGLRKWAQDRAAGNPMTFAGYMRESLKDTASDVGGAAGSRAATMQ